MAAAAVERLGHGAVGRLDVHALTKAPVHLDPIYAPGGEYRRILLPVIARAGAVPHAREVSSARIEAKGKPLLVNVVNDGLQSVGKVIQLGVQETGCVATPSPAVCGEAFASEKRAEGVAATAQEDASPHRRGE